MPPLITIKKGTQRDRSRTLTIVVSNKVSKKAPVRNLLKRRIRAIMQPLVKRHNNQSFVIITHPGVVDLSFQELKDTILNQINQFSY